jgi:hypothetical protein
MAIRDITAITHTVITVLTTDRIRTMATTRGLHSIGTEGIAITTATVIITVIGTIGTN